MDLSVPLIALLALFLAVEFSLRLRAKHAQKRHNMLTFARRLADQDRAAYEEAERLSVEIADAVDVVEKNVHSRHQ